MCRAALTGCLVAAVASLTVAISLRADDPVFSGPQKGEKLTGFEIKRVYGDAAGKTVDPIEAAAGKPVLVVFFHERTRPAFGLMRTIVEYATTRRKDGLQPTIAFLSGDPTETEGWLGKVQRLMPKDATIGVSPDGVEGPGAYGLNRNVQLTILVGKDGKVTDNFALVQPSLQADGPKVLKAIVDVLGGGEVPTIASLTPKRRTPPPARPDVSPELGGLLRSVIQKDATDEQVEMRAAKVEALVKANEKDRTSLGRIATTIVNSDRLPNYGTEKARDYLKKWAKEYGAKNERTSPDR